MTRDLPLNRRTMELHRPDVDGDCRALIGLLIKLGESLKGHQPQDRRLLDSEPLAQKTLFHACSILLLSRGTRLEDIPDSPVNFVDHASTKVLARAVLETVWAFHHIFVEPENEDDRTFRYCCWKLAGFVQRESFPAMTESAAEQLQKDKVAVGRWREELRSTQAFERLTAQDKTKALNGRLWRSQSLKATAEAFLGKKFGPATYAWLSSYQHGDALSAIQIRTADTYETQRRMAKGSLLLVAISLSNLISGYLTLWPALELVANRYPDIQELVEMYSSFPTFEGTEQTLRWE
jgi:hypothetical protein